MSSRQEFGLRQLAATRGCADPESQGDVAQFTRRPTATLAFYRSWNKATWPAWLTEIVVSAAASVMKEPRASVSCHLTAYVRPAFPVFQTAV
jgi:hypothetical protein